MYSLALRVLRDDKRWLFRLRPWLRSRLRSPPWLRPRLLPFSWLRPWLGLSRLPRLLSRRPRLASTAAAAVGAAVAATGAFDFGLTIILPTQSISSPQI